MPGAPVYPRPDEARIGVLCDVRPGRVRRAGGSWPGAHDGARAAATRPARHRLPAGREVDRAPARARAARRSARHLPPPPTARARRAPRGAAARVRARGGGTPLPGPTSPPRPRLALVVRLVGRLLASGLAVRPPPSGLAVLT